VLEAKTSPHLAHRLTGGSRAAASAPGAVTAQSVCQARRAGLGWPSHSGRGLGHPQQAALAVFGPASKADRQPATAAVLGQIRPTRGFSFSMHFRISYCFQYSQKFVQASKINKNLWKIQKNRNLILLESLYRDPGHELNQIMIFHISYLCKILRSQKLKVFIYKNLCNIKYGIFACMLIS
jgi:hypothetical protein